MLSDGSLPFARTQPSDGEVIEAVGKAVAVPNEEIPVKIDGLDSAVQLVKSVGSGQQKAIFEQLKHADEVSRRKYDGVYLYSMISSTCMRDVQRVLREWIPGTSNGTRHPVKSSRSIF